MNDEIKCCFCGHKFAVSEMLPRTPDPESEPICRPCMCLELFIDQARKVEDWIKMNRRAMAEVADPKERIKFVEWLEKREKEFVSLRQVVHDLVIPKPPRLAQQTAEPVARECCCPGVACPIHGLPAGSASGGW